MGAGVMSSGGLGTGEVKMKDNNDEPKKIQGVKPSFNFNKSTIKNNPAVHNQI
jgi:hypothetical protein